MYYDLYYLINSFIIIIDSNAINYKIKIKIYRNKTYYQLKRNLRSSSKIIILNFFYR